MNQTDEKLAPWNGAAAIVFVVIALFAFAILEGWGVLGDLYQLDSLDLTVIALAAFRLTHLFTFDKIFNFVRGWFMDRVDGVEKKPAPGFRRLMCELLECIWCTSVWAGLIALFLYVISPLGRFAVLILAVAGIASLLQVISKKIAERHSSNVA